LFESDGEKQKPGRCAQGAKETEREKKEPQRQKIFYECLLLFRVPSFSSLSLHHTLSLLSLFFTFVPCAQRLISFKQLLRIEARPKARMFFRRLSATGRLGWPA